MSGGLRNKLLAGFIILAAVAFFGSIIWYDLEHPCVQYEQRQCTSTNCALWMSMPAGTTSVLTCMSWNTHTYSCSVCVARKP